jgi:hypothetical protein
VKQIIIPVILNAVEEDLPREFVDELGEFISNCVEDFVHDYGVPVDMSISVCRPSLETVQ